MGFHRPSSRRSVVIRRPSCIFRISYIVASEAQTSFRRARGKGESRLVQGAETIRAGAKSIQTFLPVVVWSLLPYHDPMTQGIHTSTSIKGRGVRQAPRGIHGNNESESLLESRLGLSVCERERRIGVTTHVLPLACCRWVLCPSCVRPLRPLPPV